MFFIYLFIFVVGTVFASFVHLYATRMLRREAFVKGRSHCTNCNHILKWYELIPVVSYIIQGGRCRECSTPIGKDTLTVEIVTGLLFVLTFYIYGPTIKTILGCVIALIGLSIFISDFKEMIILDSTLIAGIVLVYILIYLDKGLWSGIYKSFLYGIFAFILMFVIKILGDAIFKRESLGGGDIKLAFLMGSILPYNLFLVSLIIGSTSALPYALYISLTKNKGELAFGPFLAIGLFSAYLFQTPILEVLEILTH